MKTGTISTDKITVLDFVDRPFSKVADDRDKMSIEKHGIQQPLALVPDGDRMLLADGLRRLRIAKALGISKVPYVLAEPLDGYTAEAYVRELRLALDIHRADLSPMQKCQQAMTLKERFGMSSLQLAAYIGVHHDSICNWLSLRHYLPEIVAAIEAGQLTMAAARTFNGMTPKGQKFIWKRHRKDLIGPGKAGVTKEMRNLYPPGDHAELYEQPELVTKRLGRGSKRKGKTPPVTTEEKRRLMSSLDMRELELREGLAEEKRLKAEIAAATVPIYAIMRSEKLSQFLTPDMREEMARFCEIY